MFDPGLSKLFLHQIILRAPVTKQQVIGEFTQVLEHEGNLAAGCDVRREVPISDETRRLNRVPHLPSRTGWYSFALLDRTSLNQAAGFCVLCDSWVALPADHLAHKVPFLMEDDFVESGPFPVRWYANTVSDRPGVGTEAASLLNSTYQLSVSMAPDYLIAMLSVLVKDFPVVPTYGGFSCPSEWSA